MPLIRAQCRFQMFTLLPQDIITNTLWFDSSIVGDMDAVADAGATFVSQFFRRIYQTEGIAPYVGINGHTIRFYNMSDPEPREPYVRPLVMTGVPVAATVIPTEVASVLSFHAEPQSGIPAGRLRGRIYLGGLTTATMTSVNSPGVFPTFTFGWETRVSTAATSLIEDAAAANMDWVVVSRAGGLSPVHPVVGGWVDNSPDTQRRRSVDASARVIWPTP